MGEILDPEVPPSTGAVWTLFLHKRKLKSKNFAKPEGWREWLGFRGWIIYVCVLRRCANSAARREVFLYLVTKTHGRNHALCVVGLIVFTSGDEVAIFGFEGGGLCGICGELAAVGGRTGVAVGVAGSMAGQLLHQIQNLNQQGEQVQT